MKGVLFVRCSNPDVLQSQALKRRWNRVPRHRQPQPLLHHQQVKVQQENKPRAHLCWATGAYNYIFYITKASKMNIKILDTHKTGVYISFENHCPPLFQSFFFP